MNNFLQLSFITLLTLFNVDVFSDETDYMDEATFKKYDKRKIKTFSSPSYLDAVGKLSIYTHNGAEYGCTAYLVSATPGASSNKLGSAAHCINEYTNSKEIEKRGKFKRKEIRNITWQTTAGGSTINRTAKVIDYDFDNDTLLLELDREVSFNLIKPLLIESEIGIKPGDLIHYGYVKKLIIAGFSGDSYKGNNGENLTYDDSIDPKKVSVEMGTWRQSAFPETVTFSGASGGPLIAEMDLSDEDIANPYNQMYAIATLKGIPYFSKQYLDKNGKSMGTNRPGFEDYNALRYLLDKHK